MAIFVSMIGVIVIVSGSFGDGSLLGDGLAFLNACTVAGFYVVLRKIKSDNIFPSLGAGYIIGALAVSPFANFESYSITQAGLLLLNGALIIPLAIGLLSIGLSLPIFTGPCLCLGNGGPLMANKRARPEDIITKLRQVEVLMGQGMSRLDAIRQIGVVEQTYYRWRKQYGGMGLDQLKELKRLQKENEQLRRAVSDLTLDKLILKEAAKGNF